MMYRFLMAVAGITLLAGSAQGQHIPESTQERPAERESRDDAEANGHGDNMIDDQWHFAFDIGTARIDHEDGNDTFDDSDTKLAAHVGYDLFADISAVIGYAHYGRMDTTRDSVIDQPWATNPPDTTIAAWLLYLQTDWQLGDNIYPTAGLGTAFWRARTAPGSTADERDFDALVRLGVGVGMEGGSRFEIMAESIPEIGLSTLTLGIRVDF